MSNLSFLPYVGPNFGASQVRLLLLGESHYLGDGDELPRDPLQATRTVVEKWKRREWAIRYLTIGARVITGQRAWCPSSDDLGHSAVFRSGGSGPSGVRG
ncbi:hypothetical protein ABID43_004395 [Methylobacterium goesingense]|uniref:Uncharacterized protein n=2 Tax=Methylobacterium goesingense TaxID=243690 RepID=A0ABV2LAF9_9HYPH